MTPEKKIKIVSKFELFSNFWFSLYGFWGLSLLHSPQMQRFGEKDLKAHNFYEVIAIMVWIRCLFIVILLFTLVVAGIGYLIFTVFCSQNLDKRNDLLQRLPLVNVFLNERARKFDPETN